MTQDEIIEIDEARNLAVTFGTRMCDENGDAHGEELYCVGIDDIRDIIKLVAAKEREEIDQMVNDDSMLSDNDAIRLSKAIRARGKA